MNKKKGLEYKGEVGEQNKKPKKRPGKKGDASVPKSTCR